MANNLNQPFQQYMGSGVSQFRDQQIPIQFPYGTNNLINNTPYDNYMGRGQQIFNQNQFLKCRPVSSKDEARAFQIDLDGSLWVFTDVGNEKIYTKQINTDGTATFKTYVFVEDKSSYDNGTTDEYVTKNEFNKVIQTLVTEIQSMNQSQPTTTKSLKETPTLMNF